MYTVVNTPPDFGGPFTIRPRDGNGPSRRVTGSEIRLYRPPVDLAEHSPDNDSNSDGSAPAEMRPVPAPRRSGRTVKAPPRLDL